MEKLSRGNVISIASTTGDASGYDLSGIDLGKLDLINIRFEGSNLEGADLSGSNLSGCCFDDVNLSAGNLGSSNFTGTSFRNARFKGCDLTFSTFVGADFRGAVLRYADLTRAQLRNVRHDDGQKNILDAAKRGGMTRWFGARQERRSPVIHDRSVNDIFYPGSCSVCCDYDRNILLAISLFISMPRSSIEQCIL